MKIYQAALFWLGGVLCESLADLTMGQLPPQTDTHHHLAIRAAVRELAEELALGRLSPAEYCRRALALGESALAPAALEERIVELASLRRPVVELIEQIPATVERWLVVDFPGDWWPPLSARWQIQGLFPAQRAIRTADLKLHRMVPDIFYHLPPRAGRSLDECITIDANSARAVESMKHGLASIIYVYPERLMLELALQGMFPTEADVMHPTSSQRVRI
jgi:hypothetical protein